jgi:glycosyltransferase involved in cell wall biosynthesis
MKDMHDPDISFVITSYQSESTLPACLRAISAQKLDGTVERVLVVDEPWSDRHEWLLAPEYKDVVIITPGRVGRSRSLNLGINASRARYIAIADADDECLPNRAALQVDHLNLHPKISALGGQLLQFGPWGARVADQWPVHGDDVDRRIARGRMPLAHPAMAFRRDWFDETGGYDPSAIRCEDFDLLIRGWTKGAYEALDHVLVKYRTATRFPTWRYWRREELYGHAILSRKGINGCNLVINRGLRMQTISGDFTRWMVKSTMDKLHG